MVELPLVPRSSYPGAEVDFCAVFERAQIRHLSPSAPRSPEELESQQRWHLICGGDFAYLSRRVPDQLLYKEQVELYIQGWA
jgi:hypothetical protein